MHVCIWGWVIYLLFLERPGSLLLCQYHLSLSSDLNALPQGLLQLLYALHLLTQRVLQNKSWKASKYCLSGPWTSNSVSENVNLVQMHRSCSSCKWCMSHLHLLGVLRHVVLSLPGLLHESSVPTLLHLFLVLQRCHLLRLVLRLPIGTPHTTLHAMYALTKVPLDV